MSSASHRPSERFQRVRVLYDGECPFCSAYVTMAGLKRAAAEVELIDARERPDLVAAHAGEGRPIDEGMIVEVDGTPYFGGEAVWAINAIVSRNPVLRLFGSRTVLRFAYPALRAGRNMALRLLGRTKIQTA